MKSKTKGVIIPIYIAVLIILGLFIFLFPKLTNVFKNDSVVLEYGKIDISNRVKALLVKNERLVFSDKTGKSKFYFKEGTKIKKGKTVLSVGSNATKQALISRYEKILERYKGKKSYTFSAPFTGIISYVTDGYESSFTMKKVKSITKEDIEKKYEMTDLDRSNVIKNMPCYKLIDNNEYHLVFFIPNDDKNEKEYRTGKEVTINIGYENITGIITKIYRGKDFKKIIIKSNMYYKRLFCDRTVDAKIIFKYSEGLKIDKTCLIRKEGKIGVLKKDGGLITFVRVNILLENDKEVIVSDGQFTDESRRLFNTVNYYDEILTRPKDYTGIY